jgi:hypothetical protein
MNELPLLTDMLAENNAVQKVQTCIRDPENANAGILAYH